MKDKRTFFELLAEIATIRKELELRYCQKDSTIIYPHRILAVQKLKEAIQHLNDEVNETLGAKEK